MPALQLTPANRAAIHRQMADGAWVVACLCAAWCDVCTDFRPGFEELAARHPDKLVLWIDIEDEADVVGDFDIDNFPTLLIQQGSRLSFFGTVEADAGTVGRLIAAQTRAAPAAASSNPSAGDAGIARRTAPAVDLQARLAAVLKTDSPD